MMDCAAGTALGRVGLNSPLFSREGEVGRHLGSLRSEEVRLLSRCVRPACRTHRSSLVVLDAKKVPEEWNYPWPKKISKDMEKDALKLLCRYKPLPNTPKFVMLPFEKPIIELEAKMREVRELANKTGVDFSAQIKELEEKYKQVRENLYANLTPAQRLSLARHPNRPTFYDHVLNMTDKWIELHGDRAGHDDPAIVTGIGKMEGMSFMFIGHQKGRNSKENIHRNFGMPQPWGYRKALRMMRHAEHHGFPILTFVDTPGAYPGVEAEQCGQGEAIAFNLREMFGLKVPIISTVIGEGGSGGALAIGCGNKMLMMENSVYYVASPEACAAILWKSAEAAPKATEALKITPTDLMELNVVDEVIPEPLGGAQYDPETASKSIKQVLLKHMEELLKMDTKSLLEQRLAKFRQIGEFEEGVEIEPHMKRNMKPRDMPEDVEQERLLPSGDGFIGTTNGMPKVHLDGVPGKEFQASFAQEKAFGL